MPLERHPTDPDKLVFRAHKFSRMFTQEQLDAAVAEEREACAKVCDEVDKGSQSQWPKRLATMIRARGQQ